MPRTSAQRLTWRATRASRVLALAVVMTIVGGIAADAVFISRSEPLWLGIVLLAASAVAVWLFAYRPRLIVDGTEVIVRNPVRTYRFRLCEVVEAWPGYSGIELRRRSGQPVRAWAVQKSNLARMISRRTRADAVVAEIEELVAERCGRGG